MALIPAVFGLLTASLVTGQYVEITPREAVRRLGDSLQVLCKVSHPIDSCRFTVASITYRLSPEFREGDVTYYGQGLQANECGAELRNIREDWNGNISCVVPPQAGPVELTATMRLTVARAPGEPVLNSPPQAAFNENYNFEARCVVPNGRPAAKLTWYLDGEPLLKGIHLPVVTSEPGSDLQTITQNVSWPLEADDDGKILECKSEHEALDQPQSVKRQLSVHYAPKRFEETTITIFGLKVGSEGRLNVTVRSNPAPTVDWQVGDMHLTAPDTAEDRKLLALEPLHLGNGYYNVTLVLSQIAKEDVDRAYYLTVSNELGNMQIPVRISTLDEPAGVELGAGAIVGIVIAVLILLVAIFLSVFAYATDRWCFAGTSRGTTKSSGESTTAGDVLLDGNTLPRTDTESAVGGRERSRLSGLGARVMAALPRAKDKVQATEAQVETEDKPLAEEKKGVVYAELMLGDQTSTEKPPPPSSEYAEIVYAEKPKEENKETTQ